MQPDLPTLQALAALYGQSDFQVVRKFLQALSALETKRALTIETNADVARGRAQMLLWLLETIETSRERASQLEIRSYGKPPAQGRPRG